MTKDSYYLLLRCTLTQVKSLHFPMKNLTRRKPWKLHDNFNGWSFTCRDRFFSFRWTACWMTITDIDMLQGTFILLHIWKYMSLHGAFLLLAIWNVNETDLIQCISLGPVQWGMLFLNMDRHVCRVSRVQFVTLYLLAKEYNISLTWTPKWR